MSQRDILSCVFGNYWRMTHSLDMMLGAKERKVEFDGKIGYLFGTL